jgi:hypothetical protein
MWMNYKSLKLRIINFKLKINLKKIQGRISKASINVKIMLLFLIVNMYLTSNIFKNKKYIFNTLRCGILLSLKIIELNKILKNV